MSIRSRVMLVYVVSILASTAGGEVRISESEDEGAAAFKVETEVATYYLQKQAGGFSSIVDLDGRDWIGFQNDLDAGFPAAAASRYRGLPNLVFGEADDGVGHPGFYKCSSDRVDNRTIRTTSNSGKWRWSWTFADTHADLSVELVDSERPYWFLYEGPIAGEFSPSTQYWGSSQGGPVAEFDDYLTTGGQLGRYRWAYFGGAGVERVFYVRQLTPDDLPDLMSYLGATHDGLRADDGMVVFGFGRGRDAEPMLRAPNRFRIGFTDRAVRTANDHRALAAELDSAE